MSTTTATMLERLRASQDPTKTASTAGAATQAPSVEQAQKELADAVASARQEAPAKQAGAAPAITDTAVLRNIAADLQAAETLALVKEGQVIGAALIEGMTLAANAAPARQTKHAGAHDPKPSKADLHAARLKVAYEQGLREAQALITQFHAAEETVMNNEQKLAQAEAYLEDQGQRQLQWANRNVQVGVKHASAGDHISAGAQYLDLAFECGAHSLKALANGLAIAHSDQ